jgi:hypothetical protein
MERNLNLHLKSARELMDRARGPVEINWSNWIQAGPEAYYMLSYVNWNFNFPHYEWFTASKSSFNIFKTNILLILLILTHARCCKLQGDQVSGCLTPPLICKHDKMRLGLKTKWKCYKNNRITRFHGSICIHCNIHNHCPEGIVMSVTWWSEI